MTLRPALPTMAVFTATEGARVPQTIEEAVAPQIAEPPAPDTIGPRRWIVSVRDGLALMMLAGALSAVMAYFPVGVYYHRAPPSTIVAVVHMALALFPTAGGWFGAWVVTRGSGAAREPSPRWLRAIVRFAATAGCVMSCAFAVAPALWETYEYDVVHRVATLLLVLANGLVYLHLALLARRMNRPLLAVPCQLLAVLLPALLLWADLWRLAIGLETYGRLMLLTAVPVIGTGLPQTARYAGVLVADANVATGATAPQILLLYAIAILAMLVLLELRRVLREEMLEMPAARP